MQQLSFRHSAFLTAAAVATILGIGAAAHAATDTIFRYSTPRTGFYSVSAVGMTPEVPGIDYVSDHVSGSLYVLSDGGCFTAAINLPHGVKITDVHGVWTSGGTEDSVFRLYQYALREHEPMLMRQGLVAGTGARRGIRSVPTSTSQIVNNNLYTYGFFVCTVEPADIFHGAKITYTYMHAGD
jgi:hypothetical protein